jgi:hypothetical protein
LAGLIAGRGAQVEDGHARLDAEQGHNGGGARVLPSSQAGAASATSGEGQGTGSRFTLRSTALTKPIAERLRARRTRSTAAETAAWGGIRSR